MVVEGEGERACGEEGDQSPVTRRGSQAWLGPQAGLSCVWLGV